MPARTTSQVYKRKELVDRLEPDLPARLQGGGRHRQAARQSLCRARALHRATGAFGPLGRAAHPARSGRRPGPDRGRHDPRPRQAALRGDLDRGLLRPHLPRHPGRLELRRAPVRRRDRAVGVHPPGRAAGSGARRPARQDQRRVREDRPGRDRRTARRGARRLDRGWTRAEAGLPAEADAPARPRRRFGAGEVCHRPDRPRPRRQDRPGRRPRPGDPPDHRRPDAAAAEQPDPDRRGRGGQDRRGRGLRAAPRRGRRAADAEGREPPDARRRADAGGREREGRVREAPARR